MYNKILIDLILHVGAIFIFLWLVMPDIPIGSSQSLLLIIGLAVWLKAAEYFVFRE